MERPELTAGPSRSRRPEERTTPSKAAAIRGAVTGIFWMLCFHVASAYREMVTGAAPPFVPPAFPSIYRPPGGARVTRGGGGSRSDKDARVIVPSEYRILHASSARNDARSPVSSTVPGAMGGRTERWISCVATFIRNLLGRSGTRLRPPPGSRSGRWSRPAARGPPSLSRRSRRCGSAGSAGGQDPIPEQRVPCHVHGFHGRDRQPPVAAFIDGKRTRRIWMTPGPRITMNSEGERGRPRGKTSLMVVF